MSDIYVSPSGSDSNPGTSEKPFETIQGAADVVVAGDTVIVKDGVYTDSNKYSNIVRINKREGAADNWITFKSENLYGAVLDGQNIVNTGFYLYYQPEYCNQMAHVRIEGFEIKNMRSSGISLRSPMNVYIYKNKIHSIGREFTGDCPDPPNSGGLVPCGIGATRDARYVTVDSNLLYDVGRKHHAYCCISDCKYDHVIYAGGSDWLIKNNIIYNAYSGDLLKLGPTSVGWDTYSHIVTNNVFAHDKMEVCRSCYNHARGHLWFVGPYDILIQNNIFYNPTGGYVGKSHESYPSRLTGVIFRNNAISDTAQLIHNGDENLMTKSNNVFVSNENFGMVDPENNDFTLTAAATHLINKGIATDAPAYDFTGAPRPQGAGYDIGAYEYSGAAPPAITCDQPTPHQPSGCALLKWADGTDDGIINTTNTASGQLARGEITQEEFDFIEKAVIAGSIDAICPGCYGAALAKGMIVDLTYPAIVVRGEMCDINAAIKNIGELSGSFKTRILVDGTILVTSPAFTLAGGAISTDKIDPFKAPLTGESMDIIIKCLRSDGQW